ncbi:hypothetical protein [Paenarthrobacter sp. A20]|uniref:hypothetical protein n=1 Tax=Paenarthrobacter sp. A20 TaxID=2817891 RepID=UPI00209DB5DD|nr:hypothetical protein [Paenarthrobacter sp. A20]MCP1414364.1 hypothetical protein [Paenarthrobacter sp. A20]
MSHYEDWADWAGDNSAQAERDLGRAIEYEPEEECQHEDIYRGVCEDCDSIIEPDWEPSDADLPTPDYGAINPSITRLEAWAEKQELTR